MQIADMVELTHVSKKGLCWLILFLYGVLNTFGCIVLQTHPMFGYLDLGAGRPCYAIHYSVVFWDSNIFAQLH